MTNIYDLVKDLHSDKVRLAIRAIPGDVVIKLTEDELEATVRSIAKTMDEVADLVRETM